MLLRRGFFILNLKYVLNSMDFSLISLTQNDKNSQILPKIQSKTKIPLAKKTIHYYIYKNFLTITNQKPKAKVCLSY